MAAQGGHPNVADWAPGVGRPQPASTIVLPLEKEGLSQGQVGGLPEAGSLEMALQTAPMGRVDEAIWLAGLEACREAPHPEAQTADLAAAVRVMVHAVAAVAEGIQEEMAAA